MSLEKDQKIWKTRPRQYSYVYGYRGRTRGRFRKRLLVGAFGLVVLFIFWRRHYMQIDPSTWAGTDYQPFSITGFLNHKPTSEQPCDSVLHETTISTSKSLHLSDDIQSIARQLESHPRIDYTAQDPNLTHDELIDKTWLRMAQSSAWLPHHNVYLTVTRIVFYDKGHRHWAVISFLRGQIHDENWKELKNCTIEGVTFPRVFDIEIPYVITDPFFGPEDPRVVVDEEGEGEVVVVFNMISDVGTGQRSMHLFRPFSGITTILKIRGREPELTEKNWMPFFGTAINGGKMPNQYLHFVYGFRPLRVLKCHIETGECDFVFEQQNMGTFDEDTGAVLRGGSNLYPVQNMAGRKGETFYIGFPRTHVDATTCKEAIYRPELMLLSATSETEFHVDYISAPLDFDDMANTTGDPCEQGRILIVNSVAKWETRRDVMTLSFSVDDFTTQVLSLRGVGRLVRSVIAGLSRTSRGEEAVLGCALEAAGEHAAAFVDGSELENVYEDDQLDE